MHPSAVNSDWMPYLYVAMYCVFLIAAASVAAGQLRDLWIFALTGWFLIHGHACFLFIVPVITAAVVLALAWAHRRTPVASLRRFARRRGAWVPVVAISALFALPIVVNLVLHWPGDFAKYFAYSSSSQAGGHGPGQVVRYALWFWWPHRHAWAVALLAYGAALAVARWLSRGTLRRFLLMMLAIDAVSSLAVLA